jgi:uncharacterized protein YqeY
VLEQQIEADIKTALLAGEKTTATTLRGLKSALLNVKVATNKRDTGLSDDEVIAILGKESKKRAESAAFYEQGNSPERQAAELVEKAIIDGYLPAQVSEADITAAADRAIAASGASDMKAMGQVIGQLKAQFGATADSAVIARIVKERLGA